MESKEGKEMKPTSFRVSDEAKERFKLVSKENNWNQDETLSKLINIYEIEQAKITIPSRKTEIETFESHLQALSDVYRMNLQLNQDAEERIRMGYANTLESNQKTIQQLQLENQTIHGTLDDMRKLNSELEITTALCKEYKDKNDMLTNHLAEYKEDRELNNQLQLENQELKNTLQSLEIELDTIKSNAKIQQLDLKEQYATQIEELKEKHHQTVEQNQNDYKKLLDELDMLRKENYNLKEQMLKPVATPVKKTTATRKKNETVSTESK